MAEVDFYCWKCGQWFLASEEHNSEECNNSEGEPRRVTVISWVPGSCRWAGSDYDRDRDINGVPHTIWKEKVDAHIQRYQADTDISIDSIQPEHMLEVKFDYGTKCFLASIKPATYRKDDLEAKILSICITSKHFEVKAYEEFGCGCWSVGENEDEMELVTFVVIKTTKGTYVKRCILQYEKCGGYECNQTAFIINLAADGELIQSE